MHARSLFAGALLAGPLACGASTSAPVTQAELLAPRAPTPTTADAAVFTVPLSGDEGTQHQRVDVSSGSPDARRVREGVQHMEARLVARWEASGRVVLVGAPASTPDAFASCVASALSTLRAPANDQAMSALVRIRPAAEPCAGELLCQSAVAKPASRDPLGDSDNNVQAIDLGPPGTLGHGADIRTGQGFGHQRSRWLKPPTVHFGAISITGQTGMLSAADIKRIVRERLGSVRLCYEHGLRSQPQLGGTVAVVLHYSKNGSLEAAAFDDPATTLPDTGVANCIVKIVASVSLPKLESGPAKLVLPLTFEPGEMGPPPTVGDKRLRELQAADVVRALEGRGWELVIVSSVAGAPASFVAFTSRGASVGYIAWYLSGSCTSVVPSSCDEGAELALGTLTGPGLELGDVVTNP
ncbi:MAG: AgmX/PglI C-terminal domain-containing protein [Polyangiaceae bacterium]